MDVTSPPGRSKKARAREGSIEEGDLRWSSRRSATRVGTYAESSDDEEDNITVGPYPGALLNEVESEVAEESETEIRCVCGETEDDSERGFVACDTCGVWQHVDCVEYSEDEDEAPEKKFYCDRCSPYGAIGATMSATKQPGLPVRSASQNITPKPSVPKGKTFNASSYYPNHDLSVKKSAKRVTFSPDSKAAPDSENDDPDNYVPSEDEVADGDDEEDYANDFDDNGSTLFISQSQSPSPSPNDTSIGFELAKHPRPPGVTDLGERIVRHWIAGGYAADIDAEYNEVEWGSDVSDIDIPDMSEGENLLEKIAEQDRLIFSFKKKLEKRGERIVSLKQQVHDLERENSMLKGME